MARAKRRKTRGHVSSELAEGAASGQRRAGFRDNPLAFRYFSELPSCARECSKPGAGWEHHPLSSRPELPRCFTRVPGALGRVSAHRHPGNSHGGLQVQVAGSSWAVEPTVLFRETHLPTSGMLWSMVHAQRTCQLHPAEFRPADSMACWYPRFVDE